MSDAPPAPADRRPPDGSSPAPTGAAAAPSGDPAALLPAQGVATPQRDPLATPQDDPLATPRGDPVAAFAALIDRVDAVLIRPSHAGNVGAASRALKVMGWRNLAVVSPRDPGFATAPEAMAFASGATDLLACTRTHASLDEALAPVTLAIAVSAAGREFAPPPLDPEAAARAALAELRAHPSHRVAFVFGTERTGLSIDEAQRCQRLVSIPGDAAYGSLNLSQAVQVIAYCLRREWLRALGAPPDLADDPAAADRTSWRGFAGGAQIEGMLAHLERTLVAIGFLDPAAPKRLMPRLRRLFSRTRLEVEEVDILRGICGTMASRAAQAAPAAPAAQATQAAQAAQAAQAVSKTWSPRTDARAIPAIYMRGGTSKGVFFHARDLPPPGPERDALLLRVVGSPDAYARHTDGMGGATSSTSKAVVIAPSARPGCDVDYLFGAVSIGEPLVDWSGNCGNLSAAVGPFAVSEGLVPAVEGITRVRIWQANIGARIDAYVPVRDGRVVESGDFMEDGVPFPSAPIRLEFLEADGPAPPDTGPQALLPTGRARDWLEVPGVGTLEATLVTAGNPTVFVHAHALGLSGQETAADVDRDPALLARLEAVRAHAAVRMGLAVSAEQASRERPATPKLAWVAPPAAYRSSAGVEVAPGSIDLLARIVSMGRLHHAFTGTGSIALAVAAALPGSVVHELAAGTGTGAGTGAGAGAGAGADTGTGAGAGAGVSGAPVRIGHPSGVLPVGAALERTPGGGWRLSKAVLTRSARRLMTGVVHA